MAFSAKSYGRILGANDRIRVGVVGFSNHFQNALLPSFTEWSRKMNFEIVAVSDPCEGHREAGRAFLKNKNCNEVSVFAHHEALYAAGMVDAVLISTPESEQAGCTIEAVKAGCDAYMATFGPQTMADARAVLTTVRQSPQIVQVGLQRRSDERFRAAAEYVRSQKFGSLRMVKAACSSRDFSRMRDQTDTVHWFSGCAYPRSVMASGDLHGSACAREAADHVTVVFDYGPTDDGGAGFQMLFTACSATPTDRVEEHYYGDDGPLCLPADFGSASNHFKNWMECVRSRRQPTAPVTIAYSHAVATLMAIAACHSGQRVTFDAQEEEIMAGGRVWQPRTLFPHALCVKEPALFSRFHRFGAPLLPING